MVGLATVVDDKLAPLHAYRIVPVPPLADEKRFMVPPRHTGRLLEGDATGTGLTVTDVVYTVPGLQPAPELLTVNEYTIVPVTVGTAVGLAAIMDDKAGPLQEYRSVPVPPVAEEVRFTVPPRHIGELLDGAAVGTAFTVTGVVRTPEVQPEPVVVKVSE